MRLQIFIRSHMQIKVNPDLSMSISNVRHTAILDNEIRQAK
jgi:hypothetical protein